MSEVELYSRGAKPKGMPAPASWPPRVRYLFLLIFLVPVATSALRDRDWTWLAVVGGLGVLAVLWLKARPEGLLFESLERPVFTGIRITDRRVELWGPYGERVELQSITSVRRTFSEGSPALTIRAGGVERTLAGSHDFDALAELLRRRSHHTGVADTGRAA